MTEFLTRPARVLAFGIWFAGRILASARTVLTDVVTGGSYATPRVVRLPLESETGARTAVMGALITLTPGTLTLGVVHDRRELLVHSMYHPDTDSALVELHRMEARMLRALGRRDAEVAT